MSAKNSVLEWVQNRESYDPDPLGDKDMQTIFDIKEKRREGDEPSDIEKSIVNVNINAALVAIIDKSKTIESGISTPVDILIGHISGLAFMSNEKKTEMISSLSKLKDLSGSAENIISRARFVKDQLSELHKLG